MPFLYLSLDIYLVNQLLTEVVLNIIALVFICLTCSSVLASLFYFMLLYPHFSYIGFIIIFIIYFLCFLIFAVPIQIWLRKRPKLFSIKQLLIYFSVAFLVTILLFLIYGNPDLTQVFLISSFHSIVFWLLDSTLLKDKRI
ncbi:UPF0715 family protein [Oceanobacillus jordanicus]|uniref:UPF0715 family protein n=1 Tax=Oceanobacillus jordanicus TaxID=2867266 RepID=UPI003B831892